MRSLLLAVALVAAAGCLELACSGCGSSWRFSGQDPALYDALPAAHGTAARYAEHAPRGVPLHAPAIEAAWGEAALVEIGWREASSLSILAHPPRPDLPNLVVLRDDTVSEAAARERASEFVATLWSIDEMERASWLDELFSRPVVMGEKNVGDGPEPRYAPSAWSYSMHRPAPDQAQRLYDDIAGNATLSEDAVTVGSQVAGHWTLIYAYPIRHLAMENATPELYVTTNSHGAFEATLHVADKVDEAGARVALGNALATLGIRVDVAGWQAARLG